MSAYFVARIRITDPLEYDKYLARVNEPVVLPVSESHTDR